MFNRIKPCEAGIDSVYLDNYLSHLEANKVKMHEIMMLKGNNVFFEAYYAPFNNAYNHRLYSETKSFVGIAILLLVQDNKLKLEDKIVDYFKDKIDDFDKLHPYIKEQTIENMLTMQTAIEAEKWFTSKDDDRVHLYFNSNKVICKPGTMWHYDSAGSEVLCCLVEKLTNMKLLDFLKLRLFNEMGIFKSASYLTIPTGQTWGDSAFIATIEDVASFALLLKNEGNYNGKQLIDRNLVLKATSKVVIHNTDELNTHRGYGYGYQIWKGPYDSFAFVGMGDQLCYVNKEKDLTFVCFADNQGSMESRMAIINGYYKYIYNNIENNKVNDSIDYDKFVTRCNNLKLYHLDSNIKFDTSNINKKVFKCIKNDCGIECFMFEFDDNKLVINYKNKQGKKELVCGINHNEFGYFPELGYSNLVGKLKTTDGFMYKCASSVCFKENGFDVYVQIIDKYFGNLLMSFTFNNNNLDVTLVSHAENFLESYNGNIKAKVEE